MSGLRAVSVRAVASLLLIAMTSTGCITEIFNNRVTVSTSGEAAEGVERLGPVQVHRCNYQILLIIPIVRDPKDLYDDLLHEAQRIGGNAVVDFEFRAGEGSFWFFPLFMKSCLEGVGEAARYDASG